MDDLPRFTWQPLGWQDRAECVTVGVEAFFPEHGGNPKQAKQVCARCRVRSECLDYAMTMDEHYGIWGGVGAKKRKKMKRAG